MSGVESIFCALLLFSMLRHIRECVPVCTYKFHFAIYNPRYIAAAQCIVVSPVCGCVGVFVGLLPR